MPPKSVTPPPGGRKDVNSTLPVLLDALENVQDEIAAKCRALPGPFIQQLKSLLDDFEPTFSLAPFIQGLLIAAASLSKKRMLIYLRGSQSKPFPRYMAHWHSCIAERNNAKSFIEDMTGVPMITEVMDFFKSNKSITLRALASHLCSMADGSSKNITNDSSSVLVYKAAASNENLNTWTLITDEADTILARLEDQSSSSEARFFATAWDAGRRLCKGDSMTDCVTLHFQLNMFLILQPSLKVREIVFEMEQKPIGISLRAIASTYRKPRQEWESHSDFDVADAYRQFSRKKAKTLSPLREAIWTLLTAVVVVNGPFPQSAVDAHPPGVRTSNTPASARHAGLTGGDSAEVHQDLMDMLHDERQRDFLDETEEAADADGGATSGNAINLLAGAADSQGSNGSLAPPARTSAREDIPDLAALMGVDDIEHSYVASQTQQRLDKQGRQWQAEGGRLYPSNEQAHNKLGALLAHFDELSTGASGASVSGMTAREVYRRGLSGKSKENLMSVSNTWSMLDDAAQLVQDATDRYGAGPFYAAERTLRTALLFKTRAEQQGVEDCYFYDVSFNNLATVLQVGPILCAEAMIEMSMLTNMTAFDAVYPEEAIAHKRHQEAAAIADGAARAAGGNAAMAEATPHPKRMAISDQLRSDAVKVLSLPGFAVFKKEMPDTARAEAAFMHLQQHGLGVFVTNIQVYTTNNKASTLWSDNFLTKVAGSLGHIFLKIPFDYYPVSDLAGRFTAAQIPLNTVVADPRVPINLEGANRNTGGKMASYLRWLLTALKLEDKMSYLHATSEHAHTGILSLARLLFMFSDEASVISKTNPSVNAAIATFNKPAEAAPFEDNRKGTLIDSLHRVLFNLLLTHRVSIITEESFPPMTPLIEVACTLAL
jgi:hypothetical protein